MDRVLVTGGAGFIGSHLVKELLKGGFTVKVLDNCWRNSGKKIDDILDEIEFIRGDVRDVDRVKEVVKDVDVVYHLAAILGTRYFYELPCLVLDVGLQGTLNIVKAIAKSNVQRLVFASSPEVYAKPTEFPTTETHPLIVPDPRNPRFSYSSTKIIGEVLCWNYAKKHGFDVTILRLHNPYGPNMGWSHVIPEFIKRIVLNEKFTMQGSGTMTRSFCYISDIIEGTILAGTKEEGKNEIFNIGNQSTETSINQLVSYLEEISGKRIEPVHLPAPEGGTDRRNPDISKARSLLGYNPKVGMMEGLTKTYDWYKKEIEWWVEHARGKYPWEAKRTD